MNTAAIRASQFYAAPQSFLRNPTARASASSVALDKLDLGSSGPLSVEDTIRIVNERAMSKLRGVVEQARKDLGIAEGSPLDTSAEATAGRIADFALGAYDRYRESHKLEDNEESRKVFAEFIGGAIAQGIQEARGILQSLNALNPKTTSLIDSISQVIQQRLDEFVGGASADKNAA